MNLTKWQSDRKLTIEKKLIGRGCWKIRRNNPIVGKASFYHLEKKLNFVENGAFRCTDSRALPEKFKSVF